MLLICGRGMPSLRGWETCDASIERRGCNHVDLQVHGSFANSVHSTFGTVDYGEITVLTVSDFCR